MYTKCYKPGKPIPFNLLDEVYQIHCEIPTGKLLFSWSTPNFSLYSMNFIFDFCYPSTVFFDYKMRLIFFPGTFCAAYNQGNL